MALFSSLLVGNCLADDSVDFNRDIRPILSDACFHCHGPDPGTREADLRLDREVDAKADAIVAGDSASSELIRRIRSTDPDEVMPPHHSGKQLSAKQIVLLNRWVDGGANWAKHWSFVPPEKSELPKVDDSSWPKNAVDHFVLAKLEAEQIAPSSAAEKATLARRLAFDLTGLPPSTEQVKRFVSSGSKESFEWLIDELMASPEYGERMAMEWLDAARYADSDGYQADATRQNWPWRDWVIGAFNSNMPFDQFTIEQFAGDLIEDATPEQVLATCFHRNHMHNGEGGRDPAESRVEYVIDRVNTVGTVWLGLTLGCAQCHTHKYDPISHAEYYQLNAFFNSINEDGRAGGGAKPFLKYKSPHVAEGLSDSVAWLAATKMKRDKVKAEELTEFDSWLSEQRQTIRNKKGGYNSWQFAHVSTIQTTGGTKLVQENSTFKVSGPDPRHDDYIITLTPQLTRVTGMKLRVLPSRQAGNRLSRSADGHFVLTNLKVRLKSADGSRERDLTISEAVADYQSKSSGRVYGPVAAVLDDDPRSGWVTTGSKPTDPKSAAFVFAEPIMLAEGESLVVELRQRSLQGYANLQNFTLQFTDEAGPAAKALADSPLEKLARLDAANWLQQIKSDPNLQSQIMTYSDKRPKDLFRDLQAQFLADRPDFRNAELAVARADKRKKAYESAKNAQNVTVLNEKEKPRETHILTRGVWNAKGDKVETATPVAISWSDSPPTNRLQLARWIVDRKNPLTARVIVNRYWQMFFGYGLVRTPGDFGTQGERPTHPRLLDWLAVEFMDSGWNIKHIQRLILTSATYQQSSALSPALQEQDPNNRLLARATRFRLPSWMIRDSALAASGLLERRIGGPPVFPFQPEGAWLDATMGRFRYETSVGSDRYRRSVYTFWRRSVGPTGMFDASKRRVCEVRSVRTNTPLQALTLMNDKTFVEAACAVAIRVTKVETDKARRLTMMFEQVLHRLPSDAEIGALTEQLELHASEFEADIAAAEALVTACSQEIGDADVREIAAFTMLASTILNLDEAMTRE